MQESHFKSDSLEVDYGIAIANAQLGNDKQAEQQLAILLASNEEIIPIHSALAVTQANLGNMDQALETFEHAMNLFPRNVPLTVRYCEVLLRDDQAKEAHRVLLDLLNQVPPTLEQVRLIAIAANAAGDTAEAHYYMAEYHAISGSLRLAIDQLTLALGTPGLDSVQRARFRARLSEFQAYLPDRKERDSSKNGN